MYEDSNFQLKLAAFRRKSADGTITLDEMREAVKHMRQGRVAAAATAAKSRTKAPSAAPINSDSLLDELGAL